tara:strand:- start:1371 stop:1616 length:246 start_codon:yes stop_codon:yes gene_type:complete
MASGSTVTQKPDSSNFPENPKFLGLMYSIFEYSWEKISERKFVASAPTREEAIRKVNELAEAFPCDYFDYQQTPDQSERFP